MQPRGRGGTHLDAAGLELVEGVVKQLAALALLLLARHVVARLEAGAAGR